MGRYLNAGECLSITHGLIIPFLAFLPNKLKGLMEIKIIFKKLLNNLNN